MNRKSLVVSFITIFGIAIQGCTSVGSLGMIVRSSANPTEKAKSKTFKELGIVKGKACRTLILGAFPVGNADVSRAADKAMEKSNADALINVATSNSLYGFIPIYNVVAVTCTCVKGTAIKWSESDTSSKP